MKVTFIYPDIIPHRLFWKGHYCYGIGSLSAFLKHYGNHQVSLIHITQPMSREIFINTVLKEAPDLIGFSATSHAFPLVKKLAGWFKEEGIAAPVICGGIHPTLAPDDAINTPGIDLICRGEGEEALLELCNKLENKKNITDIPSIWCKTDDTIYKNSLRSPLENMSSMPFPDRKIFNYGELFHEKKGVASVMLSRGCPYNCSYCCNHALHGLHDKKTKYTRFVTVDRAIAQIKQISKDFPFIKGINFDDDILFLDNKWGTDFMLMYKKEVGLPFCCNMRPNLVDKTKVELMRAAGCHKVVIGLESGNDFIRNKILNRNLKEKQLVNAFQLFHQGKIHTKSFNMVGIPCENTEAILDTIKLNAKMNVDEIQVTIFQPYQGTKLYELCREKGFLTDKELSSDFFSPSPLVLDTISHEQVLMFRSYFKVFIKFYKTIFCIFPAILSNTFVKFIDRVLSLKLTAIILNKIYVPLNFLFRLIQSKIG